MANKKSSRNETYSLCDKKDNVSCSQTNKPVPYSLEKDENKMQCNVKIPLPPPPASQEECAVIISKDSRNKLGIKVRKIDEIFYLSFVHNDSPAATAGIGFGDQLTTVSGMDLEKCSSEALTDFFNVTSLSSYVAFVKKRPMEVSLTGFHPTPSDMFFKDYMGRSIIGSSLKKLARQGGINGLNFLSINGKCVLGATEKELLTELSTNPSEPKAVRVMSKSLCKRLVKE